MLTRYRLPLNTLLAALLASTAAAQSPEARPETPTVKVRHLPFRVVYEADGVFVPAQATELSFSPRALEGELRIAEITPHGAMVRQGEVILRLEDEPAKNVLRAAEWAVRTTERTLVEGKARQEDLDSDSERDLARAETDLAFAEKSLKGYVEVVRPLEKEEFELSERSYKHNIADQEEELAQLGKMYKEDQLTEETEEIVLKRSKRNLEESKTRISLFQQRHRYVEIFSEPVQREMLENAVKDKRKGLRDLRRTRETAKFLSKIELEKLDHDAHAARQRLDRLREDIERMTFRAPHDGLMIHGSFEDRVAVNLLKRNGQAMPNVTLVTVARPGQLKVRFSLKEKDRYRIGAGMSAAIVPEALSDFRFMGSVEPVSGFPLPDNSWNTHVIFGHSDDRLQPLLKAKVLITLHDSMDSIVVPIGAVFRRGDRSICYVRSKALFGVAVRTVLTGPDDGKNIVIREGLSESDEVLLQEPAQ